MRDRRIISTERYPLIPEESGEVKTNSYYAGG
jgi:hypothetical protein